MGLFFHVSWPFPLVAFDICPLFCMFSVLIIMYWLHVLLLWRVAMTMATFRKHLLGVCLQCQFPSIVLMMKSMAARRQTWLRVLCEDLDLQAAGEETAGPTFGP